MKSTSTLARVVFTGALLLGAQALDRTTEAGEAAIDGVCLVLLCFPRPTFSSSPLSSLAPLSFPSTTHEEELTGIPRTDPTAECTPYSYPPVAAAVAGGQFPPIWVPVTSVPANDTEGRAKFLAMNASVPAISPKVRPFSLIPLSEGVPAPSFPFRFVFFPQR
jgi:hypothetical protein